MSYYDSRKNRYITVPTQKDKYFVDNDIIETFDDNDQDNSNATINYGDKITLKNNSGAYNILSSCGSDSVCHTKGNQGVYTYRNTKDSYVTQHPTTAKWIVKSPEDKRGPVSYGDQVFLINEFSGYYLNTCSWSKCPYAHASRYYKVSCAKPGSSDFTSAITELKWVFEPSGDGSSSKVLSGQAVRIKDPNANSYLNTCGKAWEPIPTKSVKKCSGAWFWRSCSNVQEPTYVPTTDFPLNGISRCGNGQYSSVNTCKENSDVARGKTSEWTLIKEMDMSNYYANKDMNYIKYSNDNNLNIYNVDAKINNISPSNNMMEGFTNNNIIDEDIQNNLVSVLNPPLPVAGGNNIVDASLHNQQVNKDNCKWSWDSNCIPQDVSYGVSSEHQVNQEVVALPSSCKDTNLNNNKPSIIRSSDVKIYGGNNGTVNCNTYCKNSPGIWPTPKGSKCVSGRSVGAGPNKYVMDPKWCSQLHPNRGAGAHVQCQCSTVNENAQEYLYVDGRKMRLSEEAKDGGCYSAKYWVDPATKEACKNGDNCDVSLNIDKHDISSKCFQDIPEVKGNNKYNGGSIQCKSDIRPAERVAINNSLIKEANKWSNVGRKAALLYNTKTEVAASKYGEIDKSNNLLRKQTDDSQTNKFKLDKLDNSIYSQQRQVQIGNDETRRKAENIFLLKLLLTYILVAAIPLFVKKMVGDSLKGSHVLLIFIFITIPFIYMLGWNLYSIRNRSPMRWPLRNWATGPLPDDHDLYEEDSAPTCPPPSNKVEQCQQEADALEEEISRIASQKRRIGNRERNLADKEDTLKKRLCDAKKCIPGQKCDQHSFSMSI